MSSKGSIQEGGQTACSRTPGCSMQQVSLPRVTAHPHHSLGLAEGILVNDGPETFLCHAPCPVLSVGNAP